ncbi:uncharacterized protein LOC129617528, partial [Condylostylus longicornis]|uniref:uncharacterized protein LOC129617528 n=1 Tax=Condylostylus longicornis TaxID=2530218 RepID=UPI00244D9B55
MKAEADRTDGQQQVEVRFATEMEDERFHFLSGGIVLPVNLTRRGLSEVLNTLLELEESVAFDFLIEFSGRNEDGTLSQQRVLLRTSLSKFMKAHKITSESALVLHYFLARSKFESSDFSSTDDWVVCLSSLQPESDQPFIISSGSADGSYVTVPDTTTMTTLPPFFEDKKQLSCRKTSSSSLSSILLSDLSINDSILEVIATNKSGEIVVGYHEIENQQSGRNSHFKGTK